MIIVGIDAHSRSHAAAAIDEHGRLQEAIEVTAGARGLGQLCAWIAALPQPRLIAIENARGYALADGSWPTMTDQQTTSSHASAPEAQVTAEEVAASLDPHQWDIAVAEVRPRSVTRHGGHEITIRDAVLRARKRPSP
jgi:hypothetical protein